MAQYIPAATSHDGRTVFGAPLVEEPQSITVEVPQVSGHCIRPTPIVPDTLYQNIYERSYKISPAFKQMTLQPFTKLYPNAPPDPAGWRRCITPEGRSYFWHEALNLYTNVHLTRDATTIEYIAPIESAATNLRGRHSMRPETFTCNSDLVIVLLRPGSEQRWGYYFADNARRTVFWLDRIYLSTVVASCPRFVPTDEHLNLFTEAQYWCHAEMFPDRREVKKETIIELSGLLRCAYTDAITSTTTTSPYTPEKLDQIIKTVDSIPPDDKTGQGAWIIARFMSVFKREMFLHYYGQDGARLNRDQSVHIVKQEIPRSPYWFMLVSFWLFYMPCVYRRKFNEVFVDSLLNEGHWSQLLENLRKDWEMTVTPSTVLLGANVAFLAISSVDNSASSPHRSPEQIMSYVSTVFSLASYLVCWILVQRHAPAIGESAAAGISYLKRREGDKFGLEADAIVFSLPSALFTWSMLLFSAAIIWICLVKSDFPTRLIILLVLGLMAITLYVVLHISWDSIAPPDDNLWVRNKEAVVAVRKASLDLINNGIPKSNKWRPRGLLLSQRANSTV